MHFCYFKILSGYLYRIPISLEEGIVRDRGGWVGKGDGEGREEERSEQGEL
jgi:hypothetical protein